MDAYSYLSVLLSIILGLAITQLLQGVRGIALTRGRTRLYWPTLAWGALLFLVFVQTWWAMFGLRTRQVWTFPEFLVVVVQTVLLYLLAALLFPDFRVDLDLRAHYYEQRRLFFGLLAAVTAVSVGKDVMLNGHFPESRNLAFHLFFFVVALAATTTRRELYHKATALAASGAFVLYIALLFTQLR